MSRSSKQLGLSVAWILGIVVLWYVAATGDSIRKLACLTLLAYLAAWTGYYVFSKLTRREFLIRFAGATISLGLSLGLVEMTVFAGLVDFRIVFGQPLEPWENPNNVYDEELIHRHQPHYHAKGRIEGGDLVAFAGAPPITINEFDFRYDHNGFRNPDDLKSAEIVVVGDSFVEGANVNDDELLTAQLADRLQRTVSNLGQAHYGPQQELVVVQRFGMPLKPKVCIWVFFEGNDLGDLQRYNALLKAKQTRPNATWKQRSFLLNTLFAINGLLNSTAKQSSERLSGVLANSNKTRIWFGYAGRKLTPKQVAAVNQLTETLQQAHATCEPHQCKLLVVFAPSKYRVYSNRCTFADNSPIHNWTINDLPERLKVAIDTISPAIAFIDLTREFQSAAEGDELLYYPDDTHWTPRGHELAADVISDTIRTYFAR